MKCQIGLDSAALSVGSDVFDIAVLSSAKRVIFLYSSSRCCKSGRARVKNIMWTIRAIIVQLPCMTLACAIHSSIESVIVVEVVLWRLWMDFWKNC